MSRRTRKDYPYWGQPAFQCLLCPELKAFNPDEGRRRDRHLREVHGRVLVWKCPFCPKRKPSTRFDDLRSHVYSLHYRKDLILPPAQPSLERPGWEEEARPSRQEKRRVTVAGSPLRRSSRTCRGSTSPGTPPPRKVVRRSRTRSVSPAGALSPSSALPHEDSKGELLFPLQTSPAASTLSPLPVTPGSSPAAARARPRKSPSPRKWSTSTPSPRCSMEVIPEREEAPLSPPVDSEAAPTQVVTLQGVLAFIRDTATTSERDSIRQALQPRQHHATQQVDLTRPPRQRDATQQAELPRPSRRSFGTQTTRGNFRSSRNPDGSVQLEHPSISIRLLEPLQESSQ